MKLLLGAAVAALLIASPAIAQTGAAPAADCGTFVGEAPAGAPDGATANRAAVDAYTQRFNTWAEAQRQVLLCKRQQAEAAQAAAQAAINEYNVDNAAVNTAITAWTAEVTDFNARPQQPRRDPRSVNNH
jgi:hypothetical protein